MNDLPSKWETGGQNPRKMFTGQTIAYIQQLGQRP